MLHSSFFKLLTTLGNKEVLAFHEFVLAVYHKKKVPNRLLSYILSHGTNEKAWKNITIEKAYLATFDQAFTSEKHRKKLFNTLAELNAWLTNYLVWKEVGKSSMWRQYLLTKIYFDRGLTNRFEKSIKRSIELIKTIPNGFLQPLFLMLFYHVSYFNSTAIDLLKSSKLKSTSQYLEQFYLQAKLRYVGELINRNNLREDNPDFLIPTDLLYKAGQLEHQDNNYMQLYYWVVHLSKYRTREAYEKVEHYFYSLSFTDKQEEGEILSYLSNFCLHRVRKGETAYIQYAINLYKKALESERLDFYLTDIHFINIVSMACSVEDVEWADYFIEKYSKKFITATGKDMVLLSKIRVLIARKNYEKALINLIKIKSKLFHIEKKRRVFQIKCLVELKENPEYILNHCSNFLLYLKRDKYSSQENKVGFVNHIKAIRMLQREVSKQEIFTFINAESNIAYRHWILEMLES